MTHTYRDLGQQNNIFTPLEPCIVVVIVDSYLKGMCQTQKQHLHTYIQLNISDLDVKCQLEHTPISHIDNPNGH